MKTKSEILHLLMRTAMWTCAMRDVCRRYSRSTLFRPTWRSFLKVESIWCASVTA